MSESVGITSTVVKQEIARHVGSTPTRPVVEIGASQMSAIRDDLKAIYILKQNIRTLLARRKESASLLAQYLGYKSRSSVTKFLNDDREGFEMERLDKLAAFFGLPVYILFQPGISAVTERRLGLERRSGRDRRIGHARRHVESLRAALGSDIPSGKTLRAEAGYGGRPVSSTAELGSISRQLAAIAVQLSNIAPDPAGAEADRSVPKTRPRKTKGG